MYPLLDKTVFNELDSTTNWFGFPFMEVSKTAGKSLLTVPVTIVEPNCLIWYVIGLMLGVEIYKNWGPIGILFEFDIGGM